LGTLSNERARFELRLLTMLHRIRPALSVGDLACVPERAAFAMASAASAERRTAALGRKASSDVELKPRLSMKRAVVWRAPS